MVDLTERERNVLAALLRTLRPWVAAACADEEMSGADLVDDLAERVTTKKVEVPSIDAVHDKLAGGRMRRGDRLALLHGPYEAPSLKVGRRAPLPGARPRRRRDQLDGGAHLLAARYAGRRHRSPEHRRGRGAR